MPPSVFSSRAASAKKSSAKKGRTSMRKSTGKRKLAGVFAEDDSSDEEGFDMEGWEDGEGGSEEGVNREKVATSLLDLLNGSTDSIDVIFEQLDAVPLRHK